MSDKKCGIRSRSSGADSLRDPNWDYEEWDHKTGMGRVPAEEAHRLWIRDYQELLKKVRGLSAEDVVVDPKIRQLGMSRTHAVLYEAYLAGVKFPPEGQRFDVEEQGRLVAEILDLDDKNRKAHPEDYAPEADRDRLTEAQNTVTFLTERLSKVMRECDEAHERARGAEVALTDARNSREHFFHRMQVAEVDLDSVQTCYKAVGEALEKSQAEEIRLQGLLMEANRRAEHPRKVLRRVSWILFMGLLACLAAALLTGCTPTVAAVDPCPGKPGTHCGCRAPEGSCSIPCQGCCSETPCPVEGSS